MIVHERGSMEFRLLGPLEVAERGRLLDLGGQLRVDPSELHLAQFARLVEKTRDAAPEGAAAKLRAALALWRGPPLADLAYEPFVQAEAVRYRAIGMQPPAEARAPHP